MTRNGSLNFKNILKEAQEQPQTLQQSQKTVQISNFCFVLCSPNATGSVETLDDQTETESVVSFRRERPRHRESVDQHGEKLHISALAKTIHYHGALSRSGPPPPSKRWQIESGNVRLWNVFYSTRENRKMWNFIWHNFSRFLFIFKGPAWTVRVAWSATWQGTRAPAQWWAASWTRPASVTLRMTTPWAGERRRAKRFALRQSHYTVWINIFITEIETKGEHQKENWSNSNYTQLLLNLNSFSLFVFLLFHFFSLSCSTFEERISPSYWPFSWSINL